MNPANYLFFHQNVECSNEFATAVKLSLKQKPIQKEKLQTAFFLYAILYQVMNPANYLFFLLNVECSNEYATAAKLSLKQKPVRKEKLQTAFFSLCNFIPGYEPRKLLILLSEC